MSVVVAIKEGKKIYLIDYMEDENENFKLDEANLISPFNNPM